MLKPYRRRIALGTGASEMEDIPAISIRPWDQSIDELMPKLGD